MIISNSMVALGLCYKQLASDFKNRRDEVETKLSLGADILPSSAVMIRDSIKTGMLPTIDSARHWESYPFRHDDRTDPRRDAAARSHKISDNGHFHAPFDDLNIFLHRLLPVLQGFFNSRKQLI